MNTNIYGLQAYKFAMQNTKYDKSGRAIISPDEEWNDETEWEDMYKKFLEENKNL